MRKKNQPSCSACLALGVGVSWQQPHSPLSPQLLLLQERAEDTDSKYRHIPHSPVWLILALLWDPLTALFPFSGCGGGNSSAYSKAS